VEEEGEVAVGKQRWSSTARADKERQESGVWGRFAREIDRRLDWRRQEQEEPAAFKHIFLAGLKAEPGRVDAVS
jgi:hypothetical protein